MPRTKPYMERLYGFHKELNRPYPDVEQWTRAALGLLAAQVRCERLSFFSWESAEQLLRLELCGAHGGWLRTEEEIRLTEESPLWQVASGVRSSLAYTEPHGVLYVPARWAAPEGLRAFGVLRLERPSSRKPFSAAEREFASLLAQELAQNLHRVRAQERSRLHLERLKALTDLAGLFAGALRVEDGVKPMLKGIVRRFALDRARLYLVHRPPGVLRGELSVPMGGEAVSLRSEEVALDGAHRFARILKGEEDPWSQYYKERILHLPLAVAGQKTGLLVLDNLLSQQEIAVEDMDIIKSFAGQIALAVDNARLFEEVQALSLYDSLTGLPVRRFFDQRFQEELYRAERFDQPLSLALMDVDYFKGINDTYGHQVGDIVLKEVGALILRKLRKIDFCARYGGDEILVLLPQARGPEAERSMERLLQEIRALRIPVEFAKEGFVRVTASIGLSAYPEDGRTAQDLLAKADEALYRVKARGRNAVFLHRPAERDASRGAALEP